MAKHIFLLALIGLAIVAFVQSAPSSEDFEIELDELNTEEDDEKPRFLPFLFIAGTYQIKPVREKVYDPIINKVKETVNNLG